MVKVFPKRSNECPLMKDLYKEPQKYLSNMIFMNKEIERNGFKQFQFFPLRTSIIPKYCPLDTKALIEILIKENKNDYLKDIMNKKKKIWDTFFKLEHSVFRRKGYTFNYSISTDCFGVSIQFINNANLEKENESKKKMKKARIKAKKDCKNGIRKKKKKKEKRNQK